MFNRSPHAQGYPQKMRPSFGSQVRSPRVWPIGLGGTMPPGWAEDVSNYETKSLVHEDIEAIDLEEGKWFKCKFCKNPKD